MGEFGNKIPQQLKVILKPIKSYGLAILEKSEHHFLRLGFTPKYPPVFIIGPPRSGTTLIYQALTCGLSFSYFYNLAAQFFLSPGIISYALSLITKIEPPLVFKSYYGETKGWNALSQGRMIWSRWFPNDQSYVGAGKLSSNLKAEMLSTIAIVERAFNMPFINKAQGHCVRMLPLNETFPNALFVKVNRNPFQIVQSILSGREKYFGDKNHWFSVKPKKYYLIKGHEPIEQISEQIYYLEEDMTHSINKIGFDKIFNISYEDFCLKPNALINDFCSFYHKSTGFYLKKRNIIPENFIPSNTIKVSKVEYQSIIKHLTSLWPNGVANC